MTDQTTPLRDRIAAAIREAACTGDCGKTEEECAKERIQPFAWHHGRLAVVEGSPEQFADAVLAVLPTPADHAAGPAALREAADFFERTLEQSLDPDSDPRYCTAIRDVVMGLRRRADETATTETQAHPPLHQWRVEILDGDEWMPASGLRRDRSQAAEQLRMSSERRPLWNDGTGVQRRLVRETTTYTVEDETGPAAGARQDGAHRG